MSTDIAITLSTLDVAEAAALAAGEAWLTGPEYSRLVQISAESRRRQFLAGHWLVRVLAAERLGGEPGEWNFATGDDPRPRLVHPAFPDLWASLSHSGDKVAAAISGRPVGLDLEQPGRPRDFRALSRFLFAPEEALAVEAAGEGSERLSTFYRCWTLKEARGKRGGEGLQPSQARRVAARPSSPGEAEAWHWTLPDGGALAIAASGGLAPAVEGLAGIGEMTTWRYVPIVD